MVIRCIIHSTGTSQKNIWIYHVLLNLSHLKVNFTPVGLPINHQFHEFLSKIEVEYTDLPYNAEVQKQ